MAESGTASREAGRESQDRAHGRAVEAACLLAAVALALALARGVVLAAPPPLLVRDTLNLLLVVSTLVMLRAGIGRPAWQALVVGYSANYLFWLAALGLEFGRYELIQLAVGLTAMALLLGRRWLWIGFGAACVAVLVGALRDDGLLGGPFPLAPTLPALTLPGAMIAVMGVIAIFLDRFGLTVRQALDAALARERDLARANAALRAEAAAHLRTGEQLVEAQKLEAVARLAGGVAHDFNNLLTVINCHADLLRDGVKDRPDLVADLDVLRQAGDSAASLTRQLLAFSRRQMLQPRVLDLGALVARTERMLRRVIGEDVRLVTRLAPDLWSVRADPGQLEQVVVNLAVNARDAMPRGGTLTFTTANVTLSETAATARSLAPGDHVLLSVEDTGGGMEPATLAHAFEPFFTTKGNGKGTGLGLSTVHGIVAQSGGHVSVDSAPGRGTAFRILLPRQVGEATERAARPPANPEALRGRTVLVAEDAAAVRELVCTVLRGRGMHVLSAATGDAAVDLARRHAGSIDLLLTDVVMPGLGGREAARRIGAERPGLRVLYISGYTDDAVLVAGMQQAALDVLEKPFTPEVLASKVCEVLSRGDAPATANPG